MDSDLELYKNLPLVDLLLIRRALRIAKERSMLPDLTREYKRVEEIVDKACNERYKIPRTI